MIFKKFVICSHSSSVLIRASSVLTYPRLLDKGLPDDYNILIS